MGGQIRGNGQEARRSTEGVAGVGAEHGQHLIDFNFLSMFAVSVISKAFVGLGDLAVVGERAMKPLFSIEHLTILPTTTPTEMELR
jgi:hypothetical protein